MVSLIIRKEREENIWRGKIFGPRRSRGTEKVKEENIRSTEEEKNEEGKRRKIFEKGKHFVHGGEEGWERKRRKIFGEGKNLVPGGEEEWTRKRKK